jgi:hypothetical protein
MNAKQLIAAVFILAAGSAFAGAPEQYVDFSKVQTTKTRAEVRAEVAQAARAGQLFAASTESQVAGPVTVASTRTREEVRAEAVHAAKNDALRTNYIGG